MRPDWFDLVRRGNAWDEHRDAPRSHTVGCWLRLRRWVRRLRLWGTL